MPEITDRPDRRALGLFPTNVRYWHKADNPTAPAFACYWSNSGHLTNAANSPRDVDLLHVLKGCR
jgi:hypothetical protein